MYGDPHRHICCSSTGSRNGSPDVAGSPLPNLEGRPAPHCLHSHQGRLEVAGCCLIISQNVLPYEININVMALNQL